MNRYWITIILALVGGAVGLQEFYLGNLWRGLLAVAFCWTFIPALVAFVQVCYFLYRGEAWFLKESPYKGKKNSMLCD